MLYFAYGSNMSRKRLQQRIGSAQVITIARLDGHRLVFHKSSADGSAKCDIHETGNSKDHVHGVVYQFDSSKKSILDSYEGLGVGYQDKTVSVYCPLNTEYQAISYYATMIEQSLLPYDWYKEHVVQGGREHALPSDYLRMIKNVECIRDKDTKRRIRELSIYRD